MDQAARTPGAAQGLGTRNALILIAYTASLLAWHLGPARTITYHEAFVVEGAREMLATGDWLVPRIGGEPWLEKPPLAHWGVGAAGWLAGVNEWSARLPSALCGLLGVLLLASLVARSRGPTLGLLAGLAQATTFSFVTAARLAEVDGYLWLLIVAGLAVFARRHVPPVAPARWYDGRLAFFFLVGLTQLAKGPLFGALLLLLPCAGFLLSQPRRSGVAWLFYPPGLLLVLAVACPWPAWVLLRHPEAGPLWWEHTVGRLTGGCVNPEPFWYYLTTLPWQVLPWTLILLPALPGSLRRAWKEPASLDRLFVLWLALPLVALSLSRGKHHHYLFHALPPCSYWAALGLGWWARCLGRLWDWAPWRWGAPLLAGAAAAGLLAWARGRVPGPVLLEMALMAAALILGGHLISRGCARGNPRLALAALFALLWVGYGYFHACWQHRTDGRFPEALLYRRLPGVVEADARVVIFREYPAIPLFYAGRAVESAWTPAGLTGGGREPVYVLSQVVWEADLRRVVRLARVDETPPPRPFPGQRPKLVLYRLLGPAGR